MMKSTKIFSVLLLVVIISASSLTFAANTATQTITFEVQAVNDITVSGDPGLLQATSTTPATDSSTTYDITTNDTSKKITGVLDFAMPAETTLEVELAAPTGATSAGAVALSAVAADLVTGINTVSESGLSITYTFSATALAGVIASDTRTVTFTITNL